jgi:multiple sugar transport system substrate-binding protein
MARHLTAALAVLALAFAACGSDDAGDAAAGDEEKGATAGAKVAPTLQAAQDATGDVTFCSSKDSSGALTQGVKDFNARFRAAGLQAKLLEFPADTGESRAQFIQRQRARSSECDVFYSDDIFNAEFAEQKWLLDVSAYLDARKADFVPSTLSTVQYDGKAWGVPKNTDAGFLYYRTDQVDEAPTTWQETYAIAAREDGIAYQGASYEGLTVDFLEIAFAAGGDVLSKDGRTSVIDSPENLRALEFMVEGIESGAAPKAVTTYEEEEARRAFEAGRVTFMRNWPYVFGLARQADRIRGKFAVTPLPPFEGGGSAGILGGQSLVISTYSANPEGALRFVDFMTSPELIKQDAVEFAFAPVLTATYDDPDVKEAIPFSVQLKQAVEQGRARPTTPVYAQVSQAIYENVNRALADQVSPAEALKAADEQITKALATF